jgi:hypothetical protein
VKWEIRKAKKHLERDIAQKAKTNPKAFYGYVNSKLKTRTGISELKADNGKSAITDMEKAEMLNSFFSSVQTRENTEVIPNLKPKKPTQEIGQLVVTEDRVQKELMKLNPNKSPGPDRLHPRLLKEAALQLTRPITAIYNKSLEEGIVPTQWTEGEITPIFKKGDKSKPSNYRPVSLTSVLCKVLEQIIRDHLMSHMAVHITECQHGFLTGRSCATQLLETLNIWTKLLDEKGTTMDVIYLDFAKAFDTVPHKRLLNKLEAYGVNGRILKWIANFLQNRRQRVSVNGEKSPWTNVLSGVPQGSVLGPILFICFINDMPDKVQSYLRMFADDTKVFATANSEEETNRLQKDLDSLHEWSTKWQLHFNAGKCAVMHLGHSNNQTDYSMGDPENKTTLAKTQLEKDLGVYVDPSLKFSKHCEKAANKANRILGLIRRSFDHLDKEMLKTLYRGIVRPHLEYCNAAWSPQYKKDTKLLENVQKRAFRMVPELKELQYAEQMKEMNIPSLQYRRLRGDLIETYKYLHDIYAVNAQEIFPLHDETLDDEEEKPATRGHSLKLAKLSGRLLNRQNFLSLRVFRIWNKLPESVVSAPSVETFKKRVDANLAHLWYSTEPLPIHTRYDCWKGS